MPGAAATTVGTALVTGKSVVLGRVDADLVRTVGEDADELQVRPRQDRLQRPATDVAGGPLDDAQRARGVVRLGVMEPPRPAGNKNAL
jgi:hypothetical protein